MKALILCDGSEGSLRCVEVACAAPSASAAVAKTSLIFIHIWDARAKSSSASGGMAPRPSRIASTVHAASELASAAPLPQQQQQHQQSAQSAERPSTSAAASCAEVLTATLKAVHSNKYVKGRAHYCMETISATAVDAEASEGVSHQVGMSSLPVCDTAASITAAAGGEAAASLNAVVRHILSRAAHHHVDAVFLGVGRQQEGKVCTVGTVAAQALHTLRTVYPLYYIKKDGVKWRPAPVVTSGGAGAAAAAAAGVSPLRFTIVVPIPSTAAAPPAQGGVGEAKLPVHVTADPLLASVRVGVEAAVRYVQQHCARPVPSSSAVPGALPTPASSVDSIVFFVIAPSSSVSPSVNGDEDDNGVESGAAALEAVHPGKDVSPSIVDLLMQYLATVLPATVASTADAAKSVVDEAGIPAALEDTNKAGRKALSIEASARITVCTLKASKKYPQVTLDNAEVALPQVVKQVNAAKPDVLVLPTSLTSEALQLALLSASKPHCLVLPC